MSVVPVRLFGDPVLRTRADEVVDFDAELRTLVKDLAETMAAHGGARRRRHRGTSARCEPAGVHVPL
ncbi:MAG: peptide deformylase [Mycobacteriaceae bacterium]